MESKKEAPHKPAPPNFIKANTTPTVDQKEVKSRTELVQPVLKYHCPPPHSSQFPLLKIEDLEPFKPSHYVYRSGAACSTRMVIEMEGVEPYEKRSCKSTFLYVSKGNQDFCPNSPPCVSALGTCYQRYLTNSMDIIVTTPPPKPSSYFCKPTAPPNSPL